jgi:large subunit ribosomal protein L13
MDHETTPKRPHAETQSTSTADALAARRWFVVDAKDKVLGKLASEIAHILRGKHKVMYTPHVDCGDFVIVINAEQAVLTGNKEETKIYHRHTGWMGGIVSVTAAQLRARDGRRLVERAVWGMMPKGPLGRAMYSKLKVFAGPSHPHTAQRPEQLEVA